MDAEHAAEELSYMAFALEQEYVDGDALRTAVKAIKAAQEAVERIPVSEVDCSLGATTERMLDSLQRVRDAKEAIRELGEWR